MSEHRLIYADELYETLANKLTWLMKYGNYVYLKVGRDIEEAISEQPTAYDIDEVVEEVKHLIALEFNWLRISMFEKEYIDLETAYDMDTLEDWYINSVSDNDTPVWTEEHLEELLNDFYVIPKDTSKADVAPVKHGHFRRLTFSGDTIICSECKMAYNIFETNGAENFNFCPHCGAKIMDGGEGE